MVVLVSMLTFYSDDPSSNPAEVIEGSNIKYQKLDLYVFVFNL